MKIRYWITTLLILVVITLVSSDSNPIGYEYVEEYLHTWNQNPFEDRQDIWQDSSTGYLQFFNGLNLSDAEDRARWLTHRFGLAYYTPAGGFRLFSKQQINDYEHSITTDNTTKWTQHLYKCFNKSTQNNKREFCAGWKRGQHLDATYMKNHFFFSVNATQAPFTFNKPVYYVWGFENISIENDNVTDYAHYCNKTGVTFLDHLNVSQHEYIDKCYKTYMDNTSTFERDNVTWLIINDPETERGHDIRFNVSPMRLRYEPANPMLMAQVNNGNPMVDWSGVDKVKMWWIDAQKTGNLSTDSTDDLSGYMYTNGLIIVVYKNTYPDIKQWKATPQEQRGFLAWNLSDTFPHTGVTITRVRYHQVISSLSNQAPANWQTEFFYSSSMNRLDSGDWGAGTSFELVDWSDWDKCNNNAPCTMSWNFDSRVYTSVKDSNNEGDAFTVRMEDQSLWDFWSPASWNHRLSLHGRDGCQLEISYTLTNGSMFVEHDTPVNNTNYNMTGEQMQLNLSINATGNYTVDYCDFDLNGTVVRNNTNFANGTMTQNFTVDDIADNYTWNATCVDTRGLINSTVGLRYINISELVHNVSLITPIDNTTYTPSPETNVNFTWEYNFTNEIDYCNVTIEGDIYQANASWYPQENANETACHGLWGGTFGNCNNAIDGNWNTFAISLTTNNAWIYQNYSKPTEVRGTSLWEVRDGDGRRNLTLPTECWDNNPLEFRINSTGGILDVYWYCMNATGWELISTGTVNKRIYEERMLWFKDPISYNQTYTSADAGNYSWNVTCVDVNGNEGYSENWIFNILGVVEEVEEVVGNYAIALLLGLVGGAFFLILVAVKLNSDHYPIKILFTITSLLIFLAAFRVADLVYTSSEISGIYTPFMWIILFVIIFFMITFIVNTVKSIKATRT